MKTDTERAGAPGMQTQEVLEDGAALVRRMARGDGDAVEAIFRAHGDAVYRYALRELEYKVEDAEEITQDTFLTAIELAGSYDGVHPVLPWLFGIARLRVIDHYRRRRSLKRIPMESLVALEGPEGGLEAAGSNQASTEDDIVRRTEFGELLARMESALLEDEHEALLLHYLDGFSIREVSGVLKRTEKAVKNLMTRGKQRLRLAFEAMEVEP